MCNANNAPKIGFGHDPAWSDDGETTITVWSKVIRRDEIEKPN